jgi:hypothetical protein
MPAHSLAAAGHRWLCGDGPVGPPPQAVTPSAITKIIKGCLVT